METEVKADGLVPGMKKTMIVHKTIVSALNWDREPVFRRAYLLSKNSETVEYPLRNYSHRPIIGHVPKEASGKEGLMS